MNSKTRKKIITKLLENWYSIDSVLLNGHAKDVIVEGTKFKEYIVMKASLLSNVYEYWQKVKYEPSEEEMPSDVNSLQESAVVTAKKVKELSAKMLKRENVKRKIKNIVMTEASKYGISDLSSFGDKVVQEKFLELSIDNILIGLPVLESKKLSKTCVSECKILEDSHRMIRSSLVRLALDAKKRK